MELKEQIKAKKLELAELIATQKALTATKASQRKTVAEAKAAEKLEAESKREIAKAVKAAERQAKKKAREMEFAIRRDMIEDKKFAAVQRRASALADKGARTKKREELRLEREAKHQEKISRAEVKLNKLRVKPATKAGFTAKGAAC